MGIPFNLLDQKQSNRTYVTRKFIPVFVGANHIYSKDIYTLYGDTSGSANAYDELIQKYTKSFEDNCYMTNVSIEETNGVNQYFPFKAECECISFLSGEGIVDFKNESTASINEDGSISIVRNISAKALSIKNTDPLVYARKLVEELSGKNTDWQIKHSTIPKIGSFKNSVLISESIQSDKANGVFSLQQNYLANSNQNDIQKKGIIRHYFDIQSGIDGTVTKAIRTLVLGGLNSGSEDGLAVGNELNQKSDFRVISKKMSVDNISNIRDFITIISNDQTIEENVGCKTNNTLSISYDFLNNMYKAVYDCESVPTSAMISGSSLKPGLEKAESSMITALDPLGKTYKPISTTTGQSTLGLVENSVFINSPSVVDIAGGTGYDLSLEVNYQPGLRLKVATPLLSGKGDYYIENMGLVTNSIINATASLRYSNTPPEPTVLYGLISTGFPVTINTNQVLLKDQYIHDEENKTASYFFSCLFEDKTFDGGKKG